MEIIDKIGKNLPIGSVLIIFLSSVKLIIYYNIFNVSIVDFIGIQEIIASFIDDILYYLLIFGIGLIMNWPGPPKINSIKDDFQDHLRFKLHRKYITYTIIIIVVVVSLFLIFSLEIMSLKLMVLGISSYIVTVLIYFFSMYTKKEIPYLVFVFTSIIIFTMISGSKGAFEIIENKNDLNYQIVLNEKIINTTDNIKFIGITEKYIFLYNIKNKKTSIINSSDFTEINILKSKVQLKNK